MGEVIHVEFGKKNTVQEAFVISSDLAAYLDSLRELGLEEDDILDVIEAINNVDSYFAADDEVKEFANGWLEQFL